MHWLTPFERHNTPHERAKNTCTLTQELALTFMNNIIAKDSHIPTVQTASFLKVLNIQSGRGMILTVNIMNYINVQLVFSYVLHSVLCHELILNDFCYTDTQQLYRVLE